MIEPIYIYRQVQPLSAAYLYDVAYSLGIATLVETFDMHVTLAYSTEPVNWDAPAFQTDPRNLSVEGGEQSIKRLGESAVVLTLESAALSQRWAEFVLAGAAWSFPSYIPHITLGYDPSFDVEGRPHLGPKIDFGPEIREYLFVDP